MEPLISICIPAYRQTFLLDENLQSICRQSYKNIEVLVSDDSPDDTVKNLVQTFAGRLPIRYWQNKPSLGSPANWNHVLQQAKGDYVLLLHHDDQFATDDALASFVQPFLQNRSVDFVFSRNLSVIQLAGLQPYPAKFFERYYTDPAQLVVVNMIGAPSNVLLKKEAVELYDERFKWIVDIECYTRLFQKKRRFFYIDRLLIKTGIHEGQVTNECINDSEILIYKNICYAIDNIERVRSVKVFDFYWRLIRNNQVRSLDDIVKTGIEASAIPAFIKKIVGVQRSVSPAVVRNGVSSKLLMLLTFLATR